MCRQALNQHSCTHFTRGTLATCATPSAQGHQKSYTLIPYPSACPSCQTGIPPRVSNPPFVQQQSATPSLPPYSTLSPPVISTASQRLQPARRPQPVIYSQYQYSNQDLLYATPPQAAPQPQQIIYQYPLYPIIQQSSLTQWPQSYTPVTYIPYPPTAYKTNSNPYAHFQKPPPFPPFAPGHVPAWWPRETRFEVIRGVLTPVEHFAAPSQVLNSTTASAPTSSHGWNPVHGYDAGLLPRGVGAAPQVGGPTRGRNPVHGLDIRPLQPRFPAGTLLVAAGGREMLGMARGLGEVTASMTVGETSAGSESTTQYVANSAGGETLPPAAAPPRRVSFREPVSETVGESSGPSSKEQDRGLGAAEVSGSEADGEDEKTPQAVKANTSAKLRPYDPTNGFGPNAGRITQTELEKNLKILEGAESGGEGS